MADKENIPPGGTIGVCPDGPASSFPDPVGPSGSGPEQVVEIEDEPPR